MGIFGRMEKGVVCDWVGYLLIYFVVMFRFYFILVVFVILVVVGLDVVGV